MNKTRVLTSITAMLMALTPVGSFAGDTTIGALIGVASMDSGIGTKLGLGAQVRHKIIQPFSIGANFNYANYSGAFAGMVVDSNGVATNVSGTVNNKIMHIDADLIYNADTLLPGLWAGARLGIGIITSSTSVPGLNFPSTNAFEFGPTAGYDYNFMESLSVGIDLSYLFASYSGSSLRTFQGLAALRFHL